MGVVGIFPPFWQVKGLELQRRKDVVEKNSDGTRGVLRVVKDGRMEVGKLFLFGGGYGVICLYHVFFWLFFW